MKHITIELIKDGKVFLRIFATNRDLEQKLKEIKKYYYDDYNLIW